MQNSQSKPLDTKKLLKNIFTVFILGIIINVFLSFYMDFSDLNQSLTNVKIYHLFIPFFSYIFIYIIESLRLVIVLRILKYKIPFKEAFFNSVMGYLFSFLTPIATGGQPFQIYHLKMLNIKARESSSIILSRFVENILTIILIIIIFMKEVMNILYNMDLNKNILFLGLFTSIFFAIIFLFFLIRPDLIGTFIRKIENTKIILFIEKKTNKKNIALALEKWTQELKESVSILWGKNIHIMILDILLGVLVLLLQSFSMYYIFDILLNINMNYFHFTLIYFLILIISFYIPTPGASGGIEGVYILVFSNLVKKKSMVILSIFLWRLTTYYFQIFFGLLLLMFYMKISKSKNNIRR
jgi:hypothetical protein